MSFAHNVIDFSRKSYTVIQNFFIQKPPMNTSGTFLYNTYMYFNYHAKAKRLIQEGKLKGYYFIDRHNAISPALVLLFDDAQHPVMPIRANRWSEYLPLLDKEKEIDLK